jgi:TrmH family RNA methyltransferase
MEINITITSRRNARILEIGKLKHRNHREKKGRFLLEGIRGMEDALNTGAGIHEVLVSPYLLRNPKGRALYERLVTLGIRLYGVTDEVLKYASDTGTPQGIVASVNIPVIEFRTHESQLVLLVDKIRDPGNLGTLIRSADAFGLAGIVLSGGVVDPFNPKCVRSTMGSILRMPIRVFEKAKDAIEFLKKDGFSIVAADIKAKVLCYDYNFSGKCGILIGSEAHGLTHEILSLCDSSVRIPMVGKTESLNLGVAGSVLMYEAYRQKGKL